MAKTFAADGYQRVAGVYPGLLALAPGIFFGIVMFWENFSFVKFLFVFIPGCGGSFLLAQMARDLGKKREQALFKRWGGMPSMAIFRHWDQRLSAITKQKCHRLLARMVADVSAPSPEQEKTDPESADEIYLAWSDFLRANTRGKDAFYLLHKENTNYGYRRNVWGLRFIGGTVSIATFCACAVQFFLSYKSASQIDGSLLVVGMFSLSVFALWVFYFCADWVKIPADAYATRLAESVDTVSTLHEKTE